MRLPAPAAADSSITLGTVSLAMTSVEFTMLGSEGIAVQVRGSVAEIVSALQKVLTATGFYRSERDGIYAQRTRALLVEFHKAMDLPRTETWQASDRDAFRKYTSPHLPQRETELNRLEIDLVRHLLYLVKSNKVVAIIPVSTGNGARYRNDGRSPTASVNADRSITRCTDTITIGGFLIWESCIGLGIVTVAMRCMDRE